jgi:hypothetical protein
MLTKKRLNTFPQNLYFSQNFIVTLFSKYFSNLEHYGLNLFFSFFARIYFIVLQNGQKKMSKIEKPFSNLGQ